MPHRIFRLALLIGALGASATVPWAADGPWIELFDGKDFAGWRGDPAHWQVKDSTILTKGTIAANSFLIWQTLESDFALEADVRVEGTGEANTGIQFRSRVADTGKGNWPYKVCGLQADIGPEKYGALYEECTGRIVPPDSTHCREATPSGGWEHYELLVDGPRYVLKRNGTTCFDYRDLNPVPRPDPGIVALQFHAPGYVAAFRHLRLKRLHIVTTALGASASSAPGISAAPGSAGPTGGRLRTSAHRPDGRRLPPGIRFPSGIRSPQIR